MPIGQRDNFDFKLIREYFVILGRTKYLFDVIGTTRARVLVYPVPPRCLKPTWHLKPNREWNSLGHWSHSRAGDGLGWSCQALCCLFTPLQFFLLSSKMKQPKLITLHQDGRSTTSVSQGLQLIPSWRLGFESAFWGSMIYGIYRVDVP